MRDDASPGMPSETLQRPRPPRGYAVFSLCCYYFDADPMIDRTRLPDRRHHFRGHARPGHHPVGRLVRTYQHFETSPIFARRPANEGAVERKSIDTQCWPKECMCRILRSQWLGCGLLTDIVCKDLH